MRALFTALCALFFSLGQGEEPLAVTISKDAVACESFMGFGVEWDPKFWTMGTFKYEVDPKSVTVTEADWDLVVKRIKWMRIPIMRVMICWRWCTNGDGRFDWDTVHMKSLYRHLDVCQKEGIQVILTDWIPNWWEPTPAGFAGIDDPKYAETVGTYLDHLFNTKKYSCIKHFVLVNEPNYGGFAFPAVKQGILNVAQVLAKRGLDKKLVLAGPDESNDHGMTISAVNELQGTLGAYEFHLYAGNASVRFGSYEKDCRELRDFIVSKDPQGKSKPIIAGEAGVVYAGFAAATNFQGGEPLYGLAIADLAAQTTGAGFSSTLAWMLDDSSHEGFNWGMWKNKAGGFALKPWFYTWSLLCRYVPAGSTTFRSGITNQDVRVLAAHSKAKETSGWTFCIINRAETPRTVKLIAPEAGAGTIQYYLFAKDKMAADKDGFPTPVDKKPGDFAKGVEVVLPAESVYLLTTIDLK